MQKGIFYGVGVGPGDPQLMTLKAMEVIRDCPVVAAPRTKNGGMVAMVALDIVAGAMDLADKIILPLDFVMSQDEEKLKKSHEEAAALVKEQLDRKNSVAMLNLGDVSVYASYQYLADILQREGYATRMVPGITSFCAAAAALNVSLTEMNAPLTVIPAGRGITEEEIEKSGTKIYMKAGRALSDLIEELRRENRLQNAMMVQNCGMANEKIYHRLDEGTFDNDYFSLVIVKDGNHE